MEGEEVLNFDTTEDDRKRAERMVVYRGRAYKARTNTILIRVHVPTKAEMRLLCARFGGGAYRHSGGWLWSVSNRPTIQEVKALVMAVGPTDANRRFKPLLDFVPPPDRRRRSAVSVGTAAVE